MRDRIDATQRTDRRGMALPVVIMVLLVLGASIAGGVMLARGERAIDDAGMTQVLAKSYAETGLNRGLFDRAALGLTGGPGSADSARVTVSGTGYYDVVTTRLRAAVGTIVPGLYLVRSHAVITRTRTAGGPSAEYTVTKLGTWTAGRMTVQAALTGISGISKQGTSGLISGVDSCAVGSGGTGTTIAAVAVPTNKPTSNSSRNPAGYEGSLTPLVGSPQVGTLGLNAIDAAAAVPIDWRDIVENRALTRDFTVDASGTGFPNDTWFTTHPTSWPIIFVNNGPPSGGTVFQLPNFGRGILVVYDDLDLNGNSAGWDGIVLVGGKLTSNGSNRVSGATVAGLNIQLGSTPLASDVTSLNGTKQYLYNSCNVANAVSGLGTMRPYHATWNNTFKVY